MAQQIEEEISLEPVRRAVTYRALGLGLACSAFLAWGGHYTRHIGHTTKMAQDHLPWGAVVPFLLIAIVLVVFV